MTEPTMRRFHHAWGNPMLMCPGSIRKFILQLLISAAMLVAIICNAGAAELVIYKSNHCEVSQRFLSEAASEYGMTRAGKVFPLRQVDIDSELNGAVLLNSPVDSTPTFVIVDEGHEIARMTGYPGKEYFFQIMNGAAEEFEKLSTGN